MATNFVRPGAIVEATAPGGGTTAGTPYMIGGVLFGVAVTTAQAGATFRLGTTGVWTLPADSNLVITAGDRVFWDSGNNWVDKTSAAQVCVGVATTSKIQAGTTVEVLLGARTPAGT